MTRIGRPQERTLTLSEDERDELARIGRSHSTPHSLVRRAQIILASAAGEGSRPGRATMCITRRPTLPG